MLLAMLAIAESLRVQQYVRLMNDPGLNSGASGSGAGGASASSMLLVMLAIAVSHRAHVEAIRAHLPSQKTDGGPTLDLFSLAEVNRSSSGVSFIPPSLPVGKPAAVASNPAALQSPRSHIRMREPRWRRFLAAWGPRRAHQSLFGTASDASVHPLRSPKGIRSRSHIRMSDEPQSKNLFNFPAPPWAAENEESSSEEAEEDGDKITLEKVAEYGIAGIIAIAVAETVFWVLSFPVSELFYYLSTGEYIDLLTQEGQLKFLGFTAGWGALGGAIAQYRTVLTAAAITPWIDANVVKPYVNPLIEKYRKGEESSSEEADPPSKNLLNFPAPPWAAENEESSTEEAPAPQMSMRSGVEPCPDGAKNCWSTGDTGDRKVAPWRWPPGTSRGDAIKTLREVIESYPQDGNDGVDKGGWYFTVDELSPLTSLTNLKGGYAELEFMSGLGIWAKLFNGGEPFVDDVVLNVGDESVSIFSSSRVGQSDFGVNAKRVNYIAEGLRAAGWDAPGVKG